MIEIETDLGFTVMTPDRPEPVPTDRWLDDLIWCPSQCFTRRVVNGVSYILYLRWRHSDPWSARIIKNAETINGMHDDAAIWDRSVFADNHLYFSAEELDLAKAALLEIFETTEG